MFFTILYSPFCFAEQEDMYAFYTGKIWSHGWHEFSVVFSQSNGFISTGMYSIIANNVIYVGVLEDRTGDGEDRLTMRWQDEYGNGKMEFFVMNDYSIIGHWRENSELQIFPFLIYTSQNRKPSKQNSYNNLDLDLYSSR